MNLDDFLCMWRGVSLATLKANDAPMLKTYNCRGQRNNKAMLLIHGFSSTPAVFRHFFAELGGYDAVIAPALPGHSDSVEAFSQVKASDWIASVDHVCAELVSKYKEVDVLGLSMGALLACHLSHRYPLNHLYLLAPALKLQLPLPLILKLANLLKKLGFSRFRSSAGNLYTKGDCEIAYRQLPLTSIIEILNLVKYFDFQAPSCPTDVFLGCHDEVVASKEVAALFADCKKTTLHWLTNSAHVLPLDGDRDAIINCIKQNLSVEKEKIML